MNYNEAQIQRRRRRRHGSSSWHWMVVSVAVSAAAQCSTASPIHADAAGPRRQAASYLRGQHATAAVVTEQPITKNTGDPRRLQSYTTNTCKDGNAKTLVPGDRLVRGEFLCHGSMRFGIDAIQGHFILGFVDDATENFAAAPGATAAFDATPTYVAWTAVPTGLFVEKSRPFDSLELSEDGNLFGYDENREEIYDSNYDYSIRLESNKDDSILWLSNNCVSLEAVKAGKVNAINNNNNNNNNSGQKNGGSSLAENNGGGGICCVKLKSPQMPGLPHGMITWGIRVKPDDIMAIEQPPESELFSPQPELDAEPIPTPAPMIEMTSGDEPTEPAPLPTAKPTRRPRPRPPTRSPTENNLFPQGNQPTGSISISGSSQSYESTSIIWGTVWFDSNRNGKMDVGETSVKDLEVRLFRCDPQLPNYANNGILGNMVESARTEAEGMFFFQVPTGLSYKVQFDKSPLPQYSFSFGEDTDTSVEGWTSCEYSRSDKPLQWNAGVHSAEAMPEIGALPSNSYVNAPHMAPSDPSQLNDAEGGEEAAPKNVPVQSSIGGFIYLDVDESSTMDPNEYAAAVGGYTVQDAVVVVSLTDCTTSKVLSSFDVAFPGRYSFSNLTEGFYRLGYQMVVLGQGNDPGDMPLYSFGSEDDGGLSSSSSTSFKTECGKLGKGEAIDSGNVGLRMAPLEIGNKESGEFPVGLSNEDDMELMTSPAEADPEEGGARIAAATEGSEENAEGGGGSSLVPALVGVIVTLAVVGVIVAVFVKRKRGDLGNMNLPFLGKLSHDGDDVRSVGSSVNEDTSMVSATPSTNVNTAIGSLIVEPGKSVAGLTAASGNDSSAASGSDSSSDDSDDVSEVRSYTGMEFALKNDNKPNASRGIGGVGDGPGSPGSPYQGSDANSQHSHVEQIQEDGSEGYEVYDDGEEDEEKRKVAEYGPVVSDILAKYSQKQKGQSSSGSESDEEANREAQDQSQKQEQRAPGSINSQGPPHNNPHEQRGYYPQHQEGQQNHNHAYHYQTQAQYQDRQQELAIVPSNHDGSAHYQYEGAGYQGDYQQGYYSNNAYGYPQQQPQYDETSTGGSSRSSADPPAASYRDIPTANSAAMGWDAGVQAPTAGWDTAGAPQQQPMAGWDTAGAPNNGDQYHSGDGAQYEEGAYEYNGDYESSQYPENMGNPDQYMANNDNNGEYTQGYESNQYADHGNEEVVYSEGGDYAGTYEGQQNFGNVSDPQISGSDYSSYTSDSDSSSSSSSSESGEESDTGWSSSSSNTRSTQASELSKPRSNWKHYSNARRAQSNPRDDRVNSWRHPHAAIPENSTLEDNAYNMANAREDGDFNEEGVDLDYSTAIPQVPQATTDDNKSVHSAGSDQSADPPGASYKNLHQFPPPPPRKKTPPPQHRPRSVSAGNTRRGRSVPPPPPRNHPSPPR